MIQESSFFCLYIPVSTFGIYRWSLLNENNETLSEVALYTFEVVYKTRNQLRWTRSTRLSTGDYINYTTTVGMVQLCSIFGIFGQVFVFAWHKELHMRDCRTFAFLSATDRTPVPIQIAPVQQQYQHI